jgi:hypothetical protein
MKEPLYNYDPAAALDSPEAISVFTFRQINVL